MPRALPMGRWPAPIGTPSPRVHVSSRSSRTGGRMTNRNSCSPVVGLVSGMTLLAAGAFGATPNDGLLGGQPTSLVRSTRCPPGTAVTGFFGTTVGAFGSLTQVVESATAECAAGGATGSIGTASGEPGSTDCEPGEVAVGIAGREGDAVDSLEVR